MLPKYMKMKNAIITGSEGQLGNILFQTKKIKL